MTTYVKWSTFKQIYYNLYKETKLKKKKKTITQK